MEEGGYSFQYWPMPPVVWANLFSFFVCFYDLFCILMKLNWRFVVSGYTYWQMFWKNSGVLLLRILWWKYPLNFSWLDTYIICTDKKPVLVNRTSNSQTLTRKKVKGNKLTIFCYFLKFKICFIIYRFYSF